MAGQKQKTIVMEPHIKRPMNAFMAWSKEERRQMVAEGNNSNNSVMSRILGERWKTLDEGERTLWKNEAERLKREHAAKYPDYKYKPRRRNESEKTASALSRLSPPISLTSSGNSESSSSRSPPEEVRPDTPESLCSPEPCKTSFGLDGDVETNAGSSIRQDIIEQMIRNEDTENLPPANIILNQIRFPNPKVCLPKLPQSMLASKRTNDLPNQERINAPTPVHGSASFRNILAPIDVTNNGQRPNTKPLQNQLKTTTYKKASLTSLESNRPLILKRDITKRELVFREKEEIIDNDTKNPTVDNPRTFPVLKELEVAFLGDLERTFSALALLEEKRVRGEESRHDKLSQRRIQKIDTWGECEATSWEQEDWMEDELGLPNDWRDEELFAEVERRATTERVFVKTWLPMHKLPMHNEPRLSLIRAINRRDPKMSMVR